MLETLAVCKTWPVAEGILFRFHASHPCVCQELRNVSFLGNFVYIINEWSLVVWNKFHKIIHNFGYFIAVNVPFGHSVTQLTVVQWLLLLHNFIQLSLNSGSAQVQTLLAACRRFAMVRISDNGPGWK